MNLESLTPLVGPAAAVGTVIGGVASVWWWMTKQYTKHEQDRIDSDKRHANTERDLNGVGARARKNEDDLYRFKQKVVAALEVISPERKDREFIANFFKD